jgi:hypothetical protein
MEIIFTQTIEGIPEECYPQPAESFVPDWYKKMESYLNNEKKPDGNGGTSGTIKRCMPVFDAITAGYILVTPADIWVTQKPSESNPLELQPYYEWANFGLLQFHPVEQAPNHPNRNGHNESYPKFINPWAIKTPKGYSTLFTQPMHRESVFTILDGVVDTDNYFANVNFPFALNDVKFEGLIPAGTPMAQVIPFKRDKWKMKLGEEKQVKEQSLLSLKLRSKIFDGYKTLFREKKEYK